MTLNTTMNKTTTHSSYLIGHWMHTNADAALYDNECIIKTSVKAAKSHQIQELLHYHEKLGHTSFRLIKQVAQSSVLPTRLSKYKIPLYLIILQSMAYE